MKQLERCFGEDRIPDGSRERTVRKEVIAHFKTSR